MNRQNLFSVTRRSVHSRELGAAPVHLEAKDTGPSLTHCENCGAELQGHWCAQCGQPAIEYRRSFRHVVADLLNEFLNWDSKFFTTIALLILKPWRLTNEFLAGKRVRYVNPLRLYLLASILFFFAVNYGTKGLKFEPGKIDPKDRAEIEAELKKRICHPPREKNWRHGCGKLRPRRHRRPLLQLQQPSLRRPLVRMLSATSPDKTEAPVWENR